MTSPVSSRSPSRSRSQAGGRRPAPRISGLYSDCPPEETEGNSESSPSLGPRSVSLTTLQPAIIQPRMAQLETLEAKMASIEVSLSNSPRRKKNGLCGLSLSSIRSIPKELAVKELETLRNALRDKENIIQSLKGQLTVPGLRLNSIINSNNNNNSNNRELTEIERKQAEDRLNRLKTDVDNKRLAIKNLKMALERLDITDNIDVRIQQAELEYQLGREELNLLTLLEETRTLQLCIDESNKNSSELNTLYSCIEGNKYVILHAAEVEYDPKSPKFGAGQKDSIPGLWIDWALEGTGLSKGDRLIEVNGKIVLTKNRDDLCRLLAAAPDPALLVVLRKLPTGSNEDVIPPTNTSKEVASLRTELEVVRERADEAQRAKDGLKSDNIRLTHRISYLEEQVAELLNRKSSEAETRVTTPVISKSNQNVTNINIVAQHTPVSSANPNDVQVFQKGPQVTALVSNVPSLESKGAITLPVRSKSSLSNVSNTHIPAPSPQPDSHCHKSHRHKHRSSRNSLHTTANNQSYDPTDKITYRKHSHHHHKEKDYNSESNSTSEHISRYNRRNQEHRYSTEFAKANSEKEYSSDVMDQSYKRATKIVHDLTRTKDPSSLYEKHRQKCITASEKYNADILKHYNARKSTSVLDFRSEIHIGPKYSDTRSVEEIDSLDDLTKPTSRLYKKIQDARSVKSLDFDSDCNSTSTRNGHTKSSDCTSEPSENNRRLPSQQGYYDNVMKPRPTPPKKPLRLSLHKTHSLQSVESSNNPKESHNNNEPRKPLKRPHKGEIPLCLTSKYAENGDMNVYKESQNKWSHYRRSIDNFEQGSWC